MDRPQTFQINYGRDDLVLFPSTWSHVKLMVVSGGGAVLLWVLFLNDVDHQLGKGLLGLIALSLVFVASVLDCLRRKEFLRLTPHGVQWTRTFYRWEDIGEVRVALDAKTGKPTDSVEFPYECRYLVNRAHTRESVRWAGKPGTETIAEVDRFEELTACDFASLLNAWRRGERFGPKTIAVTNAKGRRMGRHLVSWLVRGLAAVFVVFSVTGCATSGPPPAPDFPFGPAAARRYQEDYGRGQSC